jgi:hypothetical protein
MSFAGSGTVQNRVEQLGEVVQKLRVFYKDITKKKLLKNLGILFSLRTLIIYYEFT